MTRKSPEIAQWQGILHRQHRPRMVALSTGLLALAASTPDFLFDHHNREARQYVWWAVALGLIACAALFKGRTRPREVAVICLCAAAVQAALGFLLEPLILAPVLISLYLLASRVDGQTAWAITASGAVVLVAITLVGGPAGSPILLKTVSVAAWLLLPTALGTASRMHLAYLDAAHARVEHIERTREEEAGHRVLEERLRIARELHDVVAHHLAVANAQAGAVAHLLSTQPDQAQHLATELTSTTSSALRELKSTVGLLRQPDQPDSALEPAPGLGQLPGLAASFQPAGLEVTIAVDGESRPLSPTVDLTAYRIIQEALTNVTKHALATEANVRLDYSHHHVRISITNHTRAQLRPPTAPGYGLVGMTERAHSVGGQLHAGPREAGWQVTADLPLHPQPTDLSAAP